MAVQFLGRNLGQKVSDKIFNDINLNRELRGYNRDLITLGSSDRAVALALEHAKLRRLEEETKFAAGFLKRGAESAHLEKEKIESAHLKSIEGEVRNCDDAIVQRDAVTYKGDDEDDSILVLDLGDDPKICAIFKSMLEMFPHPSDNPSAAIEDVTHQSG